MQKSGRLKNIIDPALILNFLPISDNDDYGDDKDLPVLLAHAVIDLPNGRVRLRAWTSHQRAHLVKAAKEQFLNLKILLLKTQAQRSPLSQVKLDYNNGYLETWLFSAILAPPPVLGFAANIALWLSATYVLLMRIKSRVMRMEIMSMSKVMRMRIMSTEMMVSIIVVMVVVSVYQL